MSYTYFDYYNIAKQIAMANGAYDVTNEATLGQTVGGGMALCVGAPLAIKTAKGIIWDAPKWAYQNYGNYKQGFGTLLTNYKNSCAASRALNQTLKGSNWLESINNRYYYDELNKFVADTKTTACSRSKWLKLRAEDPSKAAEYLQKFKNERQLKTEIYKQAKEKLAYVKKELQAGRLKGKQLQQAFKEVDDLFNEAQGKVSKLIAEGKITPTSKLGRMAAKMKKYSGANWVSGKLTQGAKSSSKIISTTSKGIKGFIKGGGAITAAIEFAIETPDIIKEYRKNGFTAGMKRAGRAAATATASGIGFAVGAKVGAIAGAKAGAVIGTCIGGPIGTAIGGLVGSAIGIGCGLLCSWGAAEGTRYLLGKSGTKKEQEDKITQTAIEAAMSPEKARELLQAYEQTIAQQEQLVNEGLVEEQPENLANTCPQDNTYVAKEPVLNINI